MRGLLIKAGKIGIPGLPFVHLDGSPSNWTTPRPPRSHDLLQPVSLKQTSDQTVRLAATAKVALRGGAMRVARDADRPHVPLSAPRPDAPSTLLAVIFRIVRYI